MSPSLPLNEWRMWIGYTGKELLRKRVIIITLVLSAIYLALYAFGLWQLSQHAVESSNSFEAAMFSLGFMLLGLYSAQMVVAFFVLFSTMGSISGEIDNGLLLTVLARPIPRWRIYIGKWIGFGFWSLLYTAIIYWGIVAIVAVRLPVPVDAAALWRGFALFELIPLMLLSLSLLASSYLPMLGTGILTSLIYGLGWFGGMMERFYQLPGVVNVTSVDKFGLLTSFIMPADAVYRRVTYELIGIDDMPFSDQISRSLGPFGVSDTPSGAFIVYTVLYTLALLIWGAVHFTKRDV